ncbi:unnamed protein product, partial [Ascophyllum nodosum]
EPGGLTDGDATFPSAIRESLGEGGGNLSEPDGRREEQRRAKVTASTVKPEGRALRHPWRSRPAAQTTYTRERSRAGNGTELSRFASTLAEFVRFDGIA